MKGLSTLKGLNNNHLKTRNRGTVLRMIASGSVSRTDIAAHMGLSKMAITKIVGDLIEEGYLTEALTVTDGAEAHEIRFEDKVVVPLGIILLS